MRKEFAIGRIVLFSFLIGAPIRLLGIFVPALSFLDNLLTMAASIWLGTMLGMRFRRVDPVPDASVAPTADVGQPGRVASPLPVPAIVSVWLLYGLLVWDGIAQGYLGDLPVMAWEAVGQWVPSIRQLDAVGRERPKLHASLLVTALPVLVLALLHADMRAGVARVMASGRHRMAMVLLPLFGITFFFVGLDSRKLGTSFFSFALGASALFAASAYFLVLGMRVAGQASAPLEPAIPVKSEDEVAREALQALTRSQSQPSAGIPPTAAIHSAIRLLGRQHGIEEECRGALADLTASPPTISSQVFRTATRLLAMVEAAEAAERRQSEATAR